MQPIFTHGVDDVPYTQEYLVHGPVSEDCLYLNVWTPKLSSEARLPVLVWIHGGGFVVGSGSVPVYDGTALARQGIVVVTINYRLGIFGYFAYPELTREAGKDLPKGNYALQDMIAALEWVRDNIASFGGDPGTVTLAGQSSGAQAVQELMVSPLAAHLFQRATIQSYSDIGSAGRDEVSLTDAERTGEDFARRLGARSIAALRALSALALLKAEETPGSLFEPTIDRILLPQSSARLAASGKFSDMPVLIGMTADEDDWKADAEPLEVLLKDCYGALAKGFEQFYRAHPDRTSAGRIEVKRSVLRDRGLAAIYAWGRQRLKYSREPIWAYLFSHVEPGPDASRFGAFHSSNIPYVFNTLDAAAERGFTARDRDIARVASSYWVNFVKTGDPNRPSLTHWARLEVGEPQIMQIGEEAHMRPLLPRRELRVFDQYLAHGGELSTSCEFPVDVCSAAATADIRRRAANTRVSADSGGRREQRIPGDDGRQRLP